MGITEKHRKLLWGRSANRCAICKTELSNIKSNLDDESIIGEECHIVSKKENGPRYRSDYDIEVSDNYDNLILLCRNHHKNIDDQVNEYPEAKLRELKNNHEKWVEEKLDSNNIKPFRITRKEGEKSELLYRIYNGQSLLNLAAKIYASSLNHDELETEFEVELIGNFLQNVSDYIDLYDDLQPFDRTRSAFELSKQIKEIEESGFWIFANTEKRIIEGGIGMPPDWNFLIVYVVRNTNSSIISFDLDKIKNS